METWKGIVGYEGLYEVSNKGRVRRLDGIDSGGRFWKGRVLKPIYSIWGYLWVPMCKNAVRKQHAIHRLVAEAFIPNVDNKPQVNHIDGNKVNNIVENLEWATPSENARHAHNLGLAQNAKGEECNLAKLTQFQVVEIYRRVHKGEKQRVLAAEFGVNIGTISAIKLGRACSWLTQNEVYQDGFQSGN